MTEFKVGQEVECVGTNYYWHITTGKIYTVLRIANIKTIQIKNDLGYKEYYHGGLFKPILKEFEVGQKIECVDTSSNSLTAGKKYTISEMIGFGMIRIKEELWSLKMGISYIKLMFG